MKPAKCIHIKFYSKLPLLIDECFLQHLRLEENPISGMQHLEAAVILLAGPTLKKFNDKGEKLRGSIAVLFL